MQLRRFALPLLIIGILTMATMTTEASAREDGWRRTECRYQYLNDRRGFQRTEIKRTVRCVAGKFGVSAGLALDIMWRESRLNPYAVNSSSGACGLLQYWPASSFFVRLHRLTGARPKFEPVQRLCVNARSNVLAGLWEARTQGWSAWGW